MALILNDLALFLHVPDYEAEQQRIAEEPPPVIADDLQPEAVMPAGPALESAVDREVLGSRYP